MRNNLSQNWKSVIFYILIPVMLIGSIFLFSGQNKKTDVKNYSEIVNLFRTNQVAEYELDLSSGQLTYRLFDDKKDVVNKYTVPSVTYFIDDISEYVNEYNDAHTDKQITYNYKKGSTNNWWLSMLPTFFFTIIINTYIRTINITKYWTSIRITSNTIFIFFSLHKNDFLKNQR